MASLLFFPIYILPIFIAVLYGYSKAANRKEELLLAKLAGYFFIGSFIFWFEWIPLPVGLGIFYLLKPAANHQVKKHVLIFGFIISVISHLFIF